MSETRFKKNNSGKLMVTLSVCALAGLYSADAPAQSLSCFDNLLFGDMIPCGSAGTVTVRPDGTKVLGCVSAGGAPHSIGRCIVTQNFPFQAIQISITAATFTISNGTVAMNITNFNIVTNAGGATVTTSAPFVSVPIGATLNVGATQASGTYTGSFNITAVFQ